MIKSSCTKTSSLTADDLSPAGLWFVNMMKGEGLGSEEWEVPEESGNTDQTAEVPTVAELFEKIDKMEVTISNSWETEKGYGIQLNVIIKNTGTQEETDWSRKLKIKPGKKVTVVQSWCAQVTLDKKDILIKPEEYNKTVPSGGEVSGIGIIIEVE